MPKSVENVYSSALLELLAEEHGNNQAGYAQTITELTAINEVFIAAPELVKLSMIPTVSREEKLGVINNIFGKTGIGVSPYVLNFLYVLCREGRLGRFGGIFRDFRAKYYELFKITPVTVTSAFTLTDEQRAKLTEKMKTITGQQVELTEKTDKNLIGGVVVTYGGTRIDGSVKTRLDSMKREIADIVL